MAAAIPIDFNSWMLGDSWPHPAQPDSPNWILSPGGSIVEQTKNSNPSVFCGDLFPFGYAVEGQVTPIRGDDDYVGFTYGHSPGDTDNFLLIDWVVPDPTRDTAFRATIVNATASNIIIDLVGSTNTVQVGATLGNLGWVIDTSYEFRLEFGCDLRVYVDGILQLSLPDIPTPDDELCLYTFSQSARFANFHLTPLAEEDCEPPSSQPSLHPSDPPSEMPTQEPSIVPTGLPTIRPSTPPTGQPSIHPSDPPSQMPTQEPSIVPTGPPTIRPSTQPTGQPSIPPSDPPSEMPTQEPSIVPTGLPTIRPSTQPTGQPSIHRSDPPSEMPTQEPSIVPTGLPTIRPSTQPTDQSSFHPSDPPWQMPTQEPSIVPTGLPTLRPTDSCNSFFLWDASNDSLVLQIEPEGTYNLTALGLDDPTPSINVVYNAACVFGVKSVSFVANGMCFCDNLEPFSLSDDPHDGEHSMPEWDFHVGENSIMVGLHSGRCCQGRLLGVDYTNFEIWTC